MAQDNDTFRETYRGRDPGETELAIPRSVAEQALSRRTRWVLVVATIAIAVVLGLLVFGLMREYALLQAETRVRDVMLQSRAFHQYVQKVMHPAVRDLKGKGRLPENFYAPEILSSSFIVRNIHEQFSRERKAAGLPGIRYKVAAVDPRNRLNKADSFEAQLIARFNADRKLTEYREIRTENGKKYLFYARPFLEVKPHCLVCHGSANDAPLQLRNEYDWTGGYNLKVGDIVAIESIRSPLGGDLEVANWALVVFLGVSAVVLVLLLANVRLRSLVDDHLRALRESEIRFRTLYDSAIDGFVLVDAETRSLSMPNRRLLQMLGYSARELQTLRMPDLHHGSSMLALEEVFHEQMEREDEISIVHDVPVKRKDGSTMHADISSRPVELDGKPHLLAAYRDVTERREMQAQLLQARKMQAVGQLAGGVAHDFNNMLGGILGYADMLVTKLGDHPQLRRFAQRVADAAGQAADLTGKLLAFSRVGPRLTEPVDIHVVIDDALALLEHSIDPNILITRDLQAAETVVLGDGTQLQNAILNLGLNSRDAMPDGGVLTVHSDNVELDSSHCAASSFDLRPGRYVHVSVADTGTGMEPETLERAFEPFFTTKGMGKGTGLGLAAVYGTVKSHEGEIRVESDPRNGTVLHLYLPSVDQDVEDRTATVQSSLAGRGCLLLVDDEQVIRDMGRDVLEDLGYRVVLASDGEEALEIYRRQADEIDAVILDMVMPKLDGRECFREIRRLDPTAKVIISSGYAQETDISELLQEGLLGFVKKPYRRADLGRTLAAIVGADDAGPGG